MATEPNTLIKLYRGVPFDVEGKDTLYFADNASQKNYFDGLYSVSFTEQYYQRIDKETIRIQANAESIMDLNYLSITNKNHGNRTFYGFITNVSYINENTAEIKYVIDDIQSYLFYYDSGRSAVEIKDSLIEREHARTDNIGDNIIEENIDVGEYVATDLGGTNMIDSHGEPGADLRVMDIVVAMPYKYENNDFVEYNGGYYGGLYTGVYYNAYDTTVGSEMATLKNMLLDAINTEGIADSVVSIFYAPRAFWTGGNSDYKDNPAEYTQSFLAPSASFGTYTPKNNKLYTYPYNMFYVLNPNGNSAVFNYEFFNNLTPTFAIKGSYAADCEVIIYPTNYKGVVDNISEKFSMTGYPQIAFISNSYENWLAQSRNSNALSALTSTGKTIGGVGVTMAGIMSANVPLAVAGAVSVAGGMSSAENLYAQHKDRQVDALHVAGSMANSAMLANDMFDFRFYNKRITEQYAKIIDEYFTKFGYATKRVKKPDLFNGLNTRPYFYYVKTRGANIKGFASSAVLQRISRIFDNGITFWINPAQYGNYNVDNRPQ